MKLVEILNLANEGYPDGYLGNYFDAETGEIEDRPERGDHGDTLAEFVVIELQAVYEPEASDEDQLQTAIQAMEQAQDDLEAVIRSLHRKLAISKKALCDCGYLLGHPGPCQGVF